MKLNYCHGLIIKMWWYLFLLLQIVSIVPIPGCSWESGGLQSKVNYHEPVAIVTELYILPSNEGTQSTR